MSALGHNNFTRPQLDIAERFTALGKATFTLNEFLARENLESLYPGSVYASLLNPSRDYFSPSELQMAEKLVGLGHPIFTQDQLQLPERLNRTNPNFTLNEFLDKRKAGKS